MKTAVSIPDEVFKPAEKLAKAMGVSRSELYAKALRELLKRQQENEITAQINAACEGVDTHIDPALARAQREIFRSEKW